MNQFYLVWDRPRSGPVKVNQKFSFSTFGFSISVLKQNLENRVLKPQKNSLCVSQQSLIFTSLSCGTWSFFSVIVFRCSATKEGFQTQLFKTRVLTKKINYKPENGHILIYFNRPNVGTKLWDSGHSGATAVRRRDPKLEASRTLPLDTSKWKFTQSDIEILTTFLRSNCGKNGKYRKYVLLLLLTAPSELT